MGARNRIDDNTLFFAIPERSTAVAYFSEKTDNFDLKQEVSSYYFTPGYQFFGLQVEHDFTDSTNLWQTKTGAELKFNSKEKFSFEFWLSSPDASTTGITLLSVGDTGNYFDIIYKGSLNGSRLSVEASSGATQTFNYSLTDIENPHYIVVTYDESISSVSLYVDGRLIDEVIDINLFDGWQNVASPQVSLFSHIGGTVSQYFYMKFFSDLRISDKIRSQNEIAEVYNRGSQKSTRGLKPKLSLRERDFHTSSYPSRLFNSQEFSGKYNSSFDDRDTINFSQGDRLSFPMNRMSGSRHLPSLDFVTNIYAPGYAVKGVADDGLLFTPGQDLRPFDESNKFGAFAGKATGDTFWTTGSKIADVGEGFSQPTFSKKKIELDFPTEIMTTLTASTTNSLSFPTAYYNFSLRKWQGIGTGHELGASTAAGGNQFESINKSTLGFSNYSFVGYKDGPIDSYGFPFHPKFHATSSQTLSLSDVLTRPFLAEKIVLELSLSLSTSGECVYPVLTTENISPGATFFMLRQRGPFSGSLRLPFDISSTIVNYSASLPGTVQLSKSGSSTTVDTIRELITFSNIKVFGSDIDNDYYNLYAGDLNIKLDATVGVGDNYNVYNMPPQKLILSSAIRAPTKYSGANLIAVSETTAAGYGEYRNGGRFNVPLLTSGREISGAFPDGQRLDFGLLSYANPLTDTSKNSPYLLFPNDSIVFGLQGISVPTGFMGIDFNFSFGGAKLVIYGSEISFGKEANQITPQPLTSEAIHETIGFDPLFDKLDSEPSYFLSGTYTDDLVIGTMITKRGNSITTSSRKKIGSKRIRGDSVFTLEDDTTLIYPTKVLSQSVSRTFECISIDERFYDTILPDPYQYAKANSIGSNTFICSNSDVHVYGYTDTSSPADDVLSVRTHTYILSDNMSSPSSGTMLYDNEWRSAFPFSSKYSALTRVPDFSINVSKQTPVVRVPSLSTKDTNDPYYSNILVLGQMLDDEKTTNFYVTNTSNTKLTFMYTDVGKIYYHGLIDNEFKSLNNFKKAFYGIGDLGVFNIPGALIASSSIEVVGTAKNINHLYEPAIRGWKYGILNGVPQFSKAHFRRDHYGHFRDMLEQRQDSKFAIVDLNEYLEENVQKKTKFSSVKVTSSPITVNFIDLTTKQSIGPSSSSLSSNISTECTSSLPYYDDSIVRNR